MIGIQGNLPDTVILNKQNMNLDVTVCRHNKRTYHNANTHSGVARLDKVVPHGGLILRRGF